jgi:acylphosphatase
MPTIHLVIKGKVQGVFYRATAQDVAQQIGVTGWVRNTDEGNVEIKATGTEEQLQRLVAWCKQGPPKAIVTDILLSKKEEEENFKDFRILRK